MSDLNKKKILISTGGTGGHVFPALSLGKFLSNNDFLVTITTDKRGYKFLNNFKQIEIKIINSSPISFSGPIKFFLVLIKMFLAFFHSIFFLIKLKPKIIFGMGGYASFPVCLAAWLLKIPFVIYESNLVLGKANKYLLPLSKKILVSYSQLKGIKNKYTKKAVEIGSIINDEIFKFRKNYEFKNKNNIKILVLGGSQAAKSFGEKLPQIFEECKKFNIKLKIYQQCLPNQNFILEKKYKSLGIEFELFNFSKDLLKYFSQVHFVITRSGSSITAELVNCRIPFIAIPFPFAAENHQFKNAQYFEKKGFGFLLEEKDIDTKLFPLIKMIYKDMNLLSIMSEKQKQHTDKDVYKKINDQILEIIK
tara:strand:- start:638 stop:1729 length:1092 start_codon:yes stop_codon:yes gene_type:complete